MEAKLTTLLEFLNAVWQKRPQQQPKRGKPPVYSAMSFVLFFMLMLLKRIYQFKTMHKWAKANYALLGWQKAPDRKTIRRRFLGLSAVLQVLMPAVACQCLTLNYSLFGYAWSYADKSVFRALGGLWHKKHRLLGVVPHSSIDTEASWAKSEYHGWRFGYGLHLICNRYRFPLMATVTTASTKDYDLLTTLVAPLRANLSMVMADKGYFSLAALQALYEQFSVLVITPSLFKAERVLNQFQRYYNDLAGCVLGRLGYRRRKPSIEPVFAHLKDLTGLTGEHQLPYRGLDRVSSYLLVATCTVQLLMYDNYVNQRDLGSMEAFRTTFQ
jgi:hypothetical protein